MDIAKAKQSASTLYYCEKACSYDEESKALGYQGPSVAAKALAKIFKVDRKGKAILDIGGGTGLVGEELKKEGFEIIDILDTSEQMLNIARQKHVYRNIITAEVKGLHSTPVEGDYYDAILGISIVCSVEPTIACSDIREMIRLTKPGGFIVLILRTEILFSRLFVDKLLPFFDNLQSEETWTPIQRSKFLYMHGVEGQLFIYRKT